MHVAVNLHAEEDQVASKVQATNESVMLDFQDMPQLGACVLLLAQRARRGPIFAMDLRTLRQLFTQAQTALQLPQRFILYQLRHGGPSHDRRLRRRSALE
eukprot:2743854-Amphidinium_carterae.1